MNPGDVIAQKYRLERLLGSGGFGDVWVATQLSLGRQVALKTLTRFGDSQTQRFEREAQALIRLDHPNCVQLFDYGHNADGRPFIVMPLVDGAPLDAWLEGAPSLEQRLRVARQICSALCGAHVQGIVHRDLKPANIIVAPTPDGPHAVVLDFGIAKLANAPELDITKTGEVIGTPGYMSPEQLRGMEVGRPTDLYAFGVILHEMMEGVPPFAGESMLELAMLHMQAPPPQVRATDAPEHVSELILQLLAKEPRDRPPTADAVLERLTSPDSRRPSAAPAPDLSAPRPSGPGNNVLLLVVLIAVAGLVYAAYQLTRTPEEPYRPEADRYSTGKALVKQQDVPAASIDAGPGDDVRPLVCPGPIPRPGDVEFAFRLPADYGSRRHPLVVIVHDFGQQPEDIIGAPELAAAADERSYVVVAPRDDPFTNTWTQRVDDARLVHAIDTALELFCVDPQRVFMLGMGNGGNPVYQIGIRHERVTAFVTAGYRFDAKQPTKKHKHRPPYLFTNPTGDRFAPRTGGQPCLFGTDRMSLSDHEAALRDQWGCADDPSRDGDGCAVPQCEAPLEICRSTGGRLWPQFTSEATLEYARFAGCRSHAPGRDYLAQTFDFFERHDPRRSDPKDAPNDVEGVGHPAAP